MNKKQKQIKALVKQYRKHQSDLFQIKEETTKVCDGMGTHDAFNYVEHRIKDNFIEQLIALSLTNP